MFLKNHVHLPGIVLCAFSLLTAGKYLEAHENKELNPKDLQAALKLLIDHPDDYRLYAQISRFYLEKEDFRKGRFFMEEAGRLAQLYGEDEVALIECAH